ncbi:MAG: four helix bundle protein [Candidatus Marinimicrobia bacterium]|nr:four helix bundle protein [Candidatus Neomarinimicrobiota bacterium]
MKRFDLEERLISFSTLIIEIVNEMPNDKVGSNLSGQLVRSGTSVSLNYGEAQSGESRRDFIHKIKIVLKELRETFICLKLIKRSYLLEDETGLDKAIDENDQLIAIFVKSVETAQRNDKLERKKSNNE